MARAFDDAQNEFLQVESPVITAYPFLISGWFNSNDDTVNNNVLWCGDKDVAGYWTALQAQGVIGGDPVRAFNHGYGGVARDADTTAGFTAGTWHHAAGWWADASTRKVRIDGGSEGADANAVNAMQDHDRTSIGAARDSSPGGYCSGLLAEVAVWDITGWSETRVTATIESLAAGYTPGHFRDGGLGYWPLGGMETEETDGGTARDIWGGYDMTAFSDAVGPDVADHPGGLIYPSSPTIFQGAAAPPTGRPAYIIGGGIAA